MLIFHYLPLRFLFTLRCILWWVWPHLYQHKSEVSKQKSVESFWLFTCGSEALGPKHAQQNKVVVLNTHFTDVSVCTVPLQQSIISKITVLHSLFLISTPSFWIFSHCSSKLQANKCTKLPMAKLSTRKRVGICNSLYSIEVYFICRGTANSINTSNDRQYETMCSKMTQQYTYKL